MTGMLPRRLTLTFLPLLLTAAGCAAPAKAIRADFITYNETIRYNQSQQMLLNLVRLKYRESLMFLKVGALSASYSFQGGAEASLGRISDTSTNSIRLGAEFATRPTITYTPIEGNTFVKQVLTEVEPDTFALLVRSGWPVDKLCHVMVERIGDDINNEEEPTYERFSALVRTLREAQKSGELIFMQDEANPLLRYTTDRKDPWSDERTGTKTTWRIPQESIHIRSFLDIMFFLAKNTEVPEEYADRGALRRTTLRRARQLETPVRRRRVESTKGAAVRRPALRRRRGRPAPSCPAAGCGTAP